MAKQVVLINRESFERGGRKAFIRQKKSSVPKNVLKGPETKHVRQYYYGAHIYLVPKAGVRLRFG